MRFAAFLTAFAVLLTGCEAGMVQRRIVVHALGIDPAEEGSGYSVSYQVFTGGSDSDNGPVDANEQTVITLPSEGETLYDAEKNLALKTGREVFLGDVELIVISEELANRGMADFLQYFGRSDIYPGVNVVYCRGKAEDIIGEKLEQGAATAILLKGVVEKAISGSTACSSRIIELSNSLISDGESRAVPVLWLEKGEKPEEDSSVSAVDIGISESLLISDGQVYGHIPGSAVMGTRLLKCDAEKLSAELETQAGPASVEIDRISAERKIRTENGHPAVSIYITGRYDIKSAPQETSEEELRKLAEKKLLDFCSEACQEMHESGADFLNIGKLLQKYEPKFAAAQNGDFTGAARDTVFYVKVCLRKY